MFRVIDLKLNIEPLLTLLAAGSYSTFRTCFINLFNKLRDRALLVYPLKQVVRSPTRGTAILDKVYTNVSNWYECPVILPNIGRSDHDAVSMYPKTNRPIERGTDVMVTVRSRDPNGRAMLADAIQNINWTPLYRMETCEEMTGYFYNTVASMIDY